MSNHLDLLPPEIHAHILLGTIPNSTAQVRSSSRYLKHVNRDISKEIKIYNEKIQTTMQNIDSENHRHIKRVEDDIQRAKTKLEFLDHLERTASEFTNIIHQENQDLKRMIKLAWDSSVPQQTLIEQLSVVEDKLKKTRQHIQEDMPIVWEFICPNNNNRQRLLNNNN